MTTQNADVKNPEVAQLEAEQRRLAFEVGLGKAELEPELDRVEDLLDRIKRRGERQVLAEEEARVRAEAEAKAVVAAERTALARRLHGLISARSTAAMEFEHALDKALGILDAIKELDREAVGAAHTLGVRVRSSEETIGSWLAWKFTGRVAIFGPRPAPQLRRALAELLPPPVAPDAGS